VAGKPIFVPRKPGDSTKERARDIAKGMEEFAVDY